MISDSTIRNDRQWEQSYSPCLDELKHTISWGGWWCFFLVHAIFWTNIFYIFEGRHVWKISFLHLCIGDVNLRASNSISSGNSSEYEDKEVYDNEWESEDIHEPGRLVRPNVRLGGYSMEWLKLNFKTTCWTIHYCHHYVWCI